MSDVYGYNLHDILMINSNIPLSIPKFFSKKSGHHGYDLTIGVFGKLGNSTAQIKNLNGKTNLYIEDRNQLMLRSIDRFALNREAQMVIASIIHLKLLQKGTVFVHGACLSSQDEGFIVAGLSETGKTSLTINLAIRHGFEFLSDDRVITDGNMAFCYPDVMKFSAKDMKLVRNGLTPREYQKLFVRMILGKVPFQSRLTGLRFRLDPLKCFTVKEKVPIRYLYLLERGRPNIEEVSYEIAFRKFFAQCREGLGPWLPWSNLNILSYSYFNPSENLFAYEEKERSIIERLIKNTVQFFILRHDKPWTLGCCKLLLDTQK